MGCVHIIAFVLTTTLALQSGILSGKILSYKIIIQTHERVLTKSLGEVYLSVVFFCEGKLNLK